MENSGIYDYLMHHGIEGQKWGIKNGPPYPLARTRKNARAYKKAINDTNKLIARYKVKNKRTNKQINLMDKRRELTELVSPGRYNKLVEKGKQQLNNIKSLETQRKHIVKDAKSGGFIVKEGVKAYDGRSIGERLGMLYAVGPIGDYLISKKATKNIMDLPMYTFKVPKK